MNRNRFNLKDHPFIIICSIFSIGFGTAWFLAEKVTMSQHEIVTLKAIIEDDKETIRHLKQSLEVVLQEKRNLQSSEKIVDGSIQTTTALENQNRELQDQVEVLRRNQKILEDQILILRTEAQVMMVVPTATPCSTCKVVCLTCDDTGRDLRMIQVTPIPTICNTCQGIRGGYDINGNKVPIR